MRNGGVCITASPAVFLAEGKRLGQSPRAPLRVCSPRLAPALERLLARPPDARRVGPFWLVEQLGRGSFAPVWLARETYGTTFVRMAAVKLFALGSVGTRGQDRIAREARALCQVEHPHVVRFYALPIDEASGVGGLAMEHVPGRSLEQHLRARGPIPPDEVVHIGIAMALALDAVHRAGLVHRDVKPDNVIESDGVYKLIDFGIAQGDVAREGGAGAPDVGGDEAGTVRRAQGPSGTAGYVDPACFEGEAASPASDLYGLGATLHTSLVGHPPAASSLEAPPRLGPEVPAPLADLIAELVEKERRNRPGSAAEVARRLQAIRQARGEAAAAAVARGVERRPQRRRGLGAVAALVVVLAFVGAGFVRGRSTGEILPPKPADEAPKPESARQEPRRDEPLPAGNPGAPARAADEKALHGAPAPSEARRTAKPAARKTSPAPATKPAQRPRNADGFAFEEEWR